MDPLYVKCSDIIGRERERGITVTEHEGTVTLTSPPGEVAQLNRIQLDELITVLCQARNEPTMRRLRVIEC